MVLAAERKGIEMAKNQRKTTTITLRKLVSLLCNYDKVHGEYPEHRLEGKALGLFILHALGVPFEDAEKRLGCETENEYYRWEFVSPDKYREGRPGKLNLR
jgi:hypothetical protein